MSLLGLLGLSLLHKSFLDTWTNPIFLASLNTVKFIVHYLSYQHRIKNDVEFINVKKLFIKIKS